MNYFSQHKSAFFGEKKDSSEKFLPALFRNPIFKSDLGTKGQIFNGIWALKDSDQRLVRFSKASRHLTPIDASSLLLPILNVVAAALF